MTTSLVQPRDDLIDIDITQELKLLNSRHREWADEFLASGLDGKAACEAVGYKANFHSKTRDMLAHPIVRVYIEKQLAILRQQHWVRREQLLRKMQRLTDFNLMMVGTAKNGKIEIDADDYERVAREIGDMVVEVEITDDKVRVKLMDKDKMFDRELKYYGVMDLDGSKVNINIDARPQEQPMDWDKLAEPVPEDEDTIEGRILERLEG